MAERTDCYKQMKKNTVQAQNQLKETEFVTFENPQGKGLRVLFVGNSMTCHGINHEIGWHHCWGMAASAKEKDYVHLLMAKVSELCPDAAYGICQVAEWERQYKVGSTVHHLYAAARAFEADLIIMRFVENCPGQDFDGALFQKELDLLLKFLNPTGRAHTVLSTGFWRHPADEAIRALAKEQGLPLAELGDLGEDASMKAIGLFAHSGVANHPGDLGMATMAGRLFEKMKGFL